ncbi:unnamed protein product [Euphydryas editha]|uniref:Tc1-like transposase DDE domain-containing protein n=1 Tax=Euphydryas editha TaxID=104508 RepID=A0AAU9VGU8_EUPED|nr:unnamed protein product [Euphydryas editha]
MHTLRLLWAAQNESVWLRRQRRYLFRQQLETVDEMPDELFIQHFRLSKIVFKHLCRILRARTTLRGTPEIPLEIKVSKVLSLCNDDADIPHFKRTTLHKILHELGFDFAKRESRSVLLERDDIVLWRRKYLRKIKEHREANKNIYFLDETWVNAGHVKTKAWVDSKIKNKKDAYRAGLSNGPGAPTGKGKRLIVLHIGSEKGFVEGGLLLFESKSTKDYHEEMDGEKFINWFKNIIPNIEPGSVVVMDNAPYHSVKSEKIPTLQWNKQQIIDWLQSKGVTMDTSYLKKELMLKVGEISPQYNTYLVDETAKANGIEILRLPPYHCKLNPIEFVWAQIKNYIAANNSTYKLKDVEKLFYDAIETIDSNKWKKCCNHVVNEEKNMWDLDDVMELAEKNPFIINVNENSDDSD